MTQRLKSTVATAVLLVGGLSLFGSTARQASVTDELDNQETCSAVVEAGEPLAGPVRLIAASADGPRSCPKPTVGLKKDGNKVTVVTGDATQRDSIQVKAGDVYKTDKDGKKDDNGTFLSFEVEFPNYPINRWDCRATGVYVPGGEGLGTPRIIIPPVLGLNEIPGATFLVTVPASLVGEQSVQINLTCTPKP